MTFAAHGSSTLSCLNSPACPPSFSIHSHLYYPPTWHSNTLHHMLPVLHVRFMAHLCGLSCALQEEEEERLHHVQKVFTSGHKWWKQKYWRWFMALQGVALVLFIIGIILHTRGCGSCIGLLPLACLLVAMVRLLVCFFRTPDGCWLGSCLLAWVR